MTTSSAPRLADDLRAELDWINEQLHATASCPEWHFPLGRFHDSCERCWWHWRADCIDRVLERISEARR